MDEFIKALERFDSLETIIAELKGYEGDETIEDIAEYLKSEAEYANW